MSEIRIISNPYQKRIEYQFRDGDDSEWENINTGNAGQSKLISKELTTCFLPFKTTKVLETIVNEYGNASDAVLLYFKGTDDEFLALKRETESEKFSGKFILKRDAEYLNDAHSILPEISEIFNDKLRPLFLKYEDAYGDIDNEVKKYTEAVGGEIPICVLGNYSAGKSTFINALIGKEILPTGDDPVTAKIYKIKNIFDDEVRIKFTINDDEINLRISKMSAQVDDGSKRIAFVNNLLNKINEIKSDDLVRKTVVALKEINDYKGIEENECAGDLVEIRLPFEGELVRDSRFQFVIFDTPGSNSSSNTEHLETLKKAMKQFSNGLLVMVSDFDNLDTNDNEALYQKIEEIKEIDSRFAMIVVNKADEANLDKGGFTEEKIQSIMSRSIPKNLYASGIFYVSSIMGLGWKNKGKFINEAYGEKYEEKKEKYRNSSSPYYKKLYEYNIMPTQTEKASKEDAASYNHLMYANSGLYSVEKEMLLFAKKYSAYNKCQQAKLFLNGILSIAENKIEEAKLMLKTEIRNREEALREDEAKLVKQITAYNDESVTGFKNEYDQMMADYYQLNNDLYDKKELALQEKTIEKEKQTINNLDEAKDKLESRGKEMLEHFCGTIKDAFDKKDPKLLKDIGKDLLTDLSKAQEALKELADKERIVDSETAKILLDSVKEDFEKTFDNIQRNIEEKSEKFWNEKSEEFKQNLVSIINGTSIYENTRKQELLDIILTYRNIVFEDEADKLFLMEDFKKEIKIFNIAIIENEKLNLGKLTRKYNSELKRHAKDMQNTIHKHHSIGFDKWAGELLERIIDNIVSYAPQLNAQQEIIKKNNEKIERLEKSKADLEIYAADIVNKMEWKEI